MTKMHTVKQPKLKKCKVCPTKFRPFSSTTKVCGYKCALKLVEKTKEKAANKRLREGRQRLKTKSDHLKDAQAAFNKYIRLRDKNEPCISCGTTDPNIQYAAGHYLTRAAFPELRFDEDNVHKQCNRRCNMELSGNIAAYRINLVKKIGIDRVEILEGPHKAANLIIDDVLAIKAKYLKKAREIKQ